MVGQRDQDHALVQGQIVVGDLTATRVHGVKEPEIAVQGIAFRQLPQVDDGFLRVRQQASAAACGVTAPAT